MKSWLGLASVAVRVLGIDPGMTVTGWGIVEPAGRTLRMIAYGSIRSTPQQPLPERLGQIFAGLGTVIRSHAPVTVAIEEVFMASNAQSAIKLGQARGAAIVAARHHDLPVHEYAALVVKKAVVGYGRAEKGQVQAMMRMLLTLETTPPPDAADALAIAICHIHHGNHALHHP